MDLHGKVALVTGGAVRVGKAIALALADGGADIAFSYNTSVEAAAETAAEIRAKGRRAFYAKADAGQVSEAQALVEAAAANLGRLDVLVNSASLWRRTPFATLDEATWDRVYSVMVKGTAFTSHAAAPYLTAHGDGAIVNIIDLSAYLPFPNFMAHSAGKAGVLNLTYSLAAELAPAVRVNAIAPGPVMPQPGLTEEELRATARRTLLRRWGSPEDVAGAVRFLAEASYITGAVIHVDGGEHLMRRG